MTISKHNSLFHQVDLSLLRYFFDVAKFGGFSKASRATGVSQPALSLGVQKLEKALGVKLLVRGRRGGAGAFSLTDPGKELFRFCERFESGLQSVMNSFGREPASRRLLRVGTALSVGFSPLIPLCSRTTQKDRLLDIEMVTQNTYDLIKAVSESSLDAAILPDDVHESSLRLEPLHEDQIIFVVGKKAASSLRYPDWARRLEELNLINYPRETPMRSLIDKLIREKQLHFRRTFSVNSLEAMKTMVARNLGGAFVLKSLVLDDLKAGILVEPKDKVVRIRSGVVLATRKDARGAEVSKELLDYLK